MTPNLLSSRTTLAADAPDHRRCGLIAAAVALALGTVSPVLAQSDSSQEIQQLKDQMRQMQEKLDQLERQQQAQQQAAAAQATPNPPPPPPPPGAPARPAGPGIAAGPLTITFGGFTELASIYRNRNEIADVGSVPFSQIPVPTASNYYLSEFRESARQSRFAMLTQGPEWNGVKPEAYLETDFLGAAPTANSRESNSYNLRVRTFYADATWVDTGLYFLAGQSWSLATLYKNGLEARQEDVPLTIDAQYVAGFNWTRNPQVRIVEKFSDMFSLGISAESPQGVPNATNNVPSTLSAYPANTYYQPTGNAAGLLDNATGYTVDPAPDVIVKAALDPGWGHYELYGLGRAFRSEVGTASNTVYGGGIGGGFILPLVQDVLSVQASGLIGKGIGRYGSSQLPDVTLEPNGDFSPIREYSALVGVFYYPWPSLQTYIYGGREQASADYFDATITAGGTTLYGYGYGNPLYNNSGCYDLAGKKCVFNAQTVDEVTAGFWWKYYRGPLGNLQLGLQLAYNQVDAFSGVGGAPSTNVFEGEVSFRYYPFQK